MGCDIHLVLERKYKNKWIGVNCFRPIDNPYDQSYTFPEVTERNYTRFGKLAGVRREGDRVPLGLPADASDLTKALVEEWGVDGHSYSYMTAELFAKIVLETCGEVSDRTKKYPCSTFLQAESENSPDYRVVFWFDN